MNMIINFKKTKESKKTKQTHYKIIFHIILTVYAKNRQMEDI